MNTPRVNSFDGWVLRADIGELEKDGRKHRLQQLPLLVLEELLAHPGALVTREQLIARLWPKGVVDFDTGLNTAVRKLRVALEDVGEVPRYIETIPRRGYRFVGVVDPPAEEVALAAPPVSSAAPAEPPAATAMSPSPSAEMDSPPGGERRAADRRVASAEAAPTTGPASSRRGLVFAAAFLLLLIAAGAAWWVRRPSPAESHGMTVRLSGFQLLSTDLPAPLRETVDAEITAAFNIDGVVKVSSASAPTSAAPAYSLGGTIQREGQTIRVITNMINERSGAAVWSKTSNYDGNEVSRVPRHIAVDVGNVVRCGLFGATTYHKPLPDEVLRDYMQFCEGHWDPNVRDGRKALVPAQRVVAAVPDFSWGWAAVAGAYWKVALSADGPQFVEEARASGREAADKAIAIDAKNSEALYIKSMVLDRHDWSGREDLLKRAIAAHRLDCGCEYHQYGWMLLNVGRTAEAVEQLHQANDMLALYLYTPLNLAEALVIAGKPDEAKRHFDAAIELAPSAGFAQRLTVDKATQVGDVDRLLDPALPIPEDMRATLVKAYRARASQDSAAKAQAAHDLLALPEALQTKAVARLLGDLGADREAFQVAARIVTTKEYPGPSLLWDPSMRRTLSDPGFPALVSQLGLMNYWKTSGTRPDVCNEASPPPFCQAIRGD